MKKSLLAASSLALGIMLLVGGALAALPWQESPAAVIVKVDGAVEVHRDGAIRTAAVGDRLADGDRLVPAADARAVIVSRTGASRTVIEEVTIEAAGDGADGAMFSRTMRVLAQAATTDARSQPNRQGMIRPLPGQPALIAPRNDLSLMSVRPTFTWFAVPGATAYRLQIRRDGKPPVRFELGADTVWTLPADAAPLLTGESYRWTIAPVGSGRVASEGVFRVLDEDGLKEVSENLDLLRELGLDPDDEGLFLSAVIFQEAGLMYEAAGALERLERSGAPTGPGVHLLKGDILNALGDLDGASAAFDRADALQRAAESAGAVGAGAAGAAGTNEAGGVAGTNEAGGAAGAARR